MDECVPVVPSGGVAHVPVDVLDDVIDGAAESLVPCRLKGLQILRVLTR